MPAAAIKSYSYDIASETLEIIYHSGKVYHNLKVPKKNFQGNTPDDGQGHPVYRQVEGKYEFKEVTPGLNQKGLFYFQQCSSNNSLQVNRFRKPLLNCQVV